MAVLAINNQHYCVFTLHCYVLREMRVLHVPEMTTTATAVIADEADCTPFLYSMQYTPLGVHHGSSAVFKRGLTDSTPLIRLIGAYPNGRISTPSSYQ